MNMNRQLTYMLCNTFFAPMYTAFREVNEKKLAIIRSYNILRLKIAMRYSETVKVIYQHEYLKSVAGCAPSRHIHRCNVITTGLPFLWRQVIPRIENTIMYIEDKNINVFAFKCAVATWSDAIL